jgi:RNA polymerase sigma factor (sigma-70 family)
MLSDTELLAKYCATPTPELFALIVERHGPMVLRTCGRVTGNVQDAEDAAQATFLVLARRPNAVGYNLAGWLHKVARDAAAQVVRTRVRRIRREEDLARMKAPPPPSENTDELREELDAALVRLPGPLREAVVLHYLEGREHKEAAHLAGCTEATLRWRAMKGVHRLRDILARRHIVFGSAALAAFLSAEAARAASAAQLTTWAAAGGATATVGQAATVAHAVSRGIFWAKVKVWLLAMATAGAVVSVPVAVQLAPSPSAPPPPPARVGLGVNASLGGRLLLPGDSPWNQDISHAPVDPRSDTLIGTIGADQPLRASFGNWINGKPGAGESYIVVAGDTPRVPVRFSIPTESDPGPYPIPDKIPPSDEGRHPLLMLDRDRWLLYELSDIESGPGGWRANAGAIFDLKTGGNRPAGWTSADGAGLPILPGLVRFDEVAEQGEIRHALRFSCPKTRRAYVAPATHWASELTNPKLPPMGLRVRLKADRDLSSYPPQARVILRALQTYGMFLAEHGSSWYVSGTSDQRWDAEALKTLQQLHGRDFEVVQMGEIVTDRKR